MQHRKQRRASGNTGCGFLIGVIYIMVLSWLYPIVYDEYILWFHDLFNLIVAINSR